MTDDTLPIRILHLHSSFAAGGKELRAAKLMNAFGPKVRHAVVSGQPGEIGAAEAIAGHIPVAYPSDFPSLTGTPLPGRLHRLAQRMAAYDLVLTYNWGAMDAVLAHTLFAERMGLPALIHHEDGFNLDEAERRLTRRNWYRRIALGRSAALVVPSHTLARIAREEWAQPAARIHRIPNGIATKAFGRKPKPTALPRLIKRTGEKWVGTMAGLRPVKDLPLLVRAFASLSEEWHLVIAGTGPERPAIEDEAERLDILHRVHLPGFVADPAKVMGLFDIFALSSRSEQFPLSVVEAMAAGLPVAAPRVGDVARIVAEPNVPLLAERGDEAGLADALARLAQSEALRTEIGKANRTRAREQFDEAEMAAGYRRLYNRFLPPGQTL